VGGDCWPWRRHGAWFLGDMRHQPDGPRGDDQGSTKAYAVHKSDLWVTYEYDAAAVEYAQPIALPISSLRVNDLGDMMAVKSFSSDNLRGRFEDTEQPRR
jgi:hypothetical protein